MNEGGSYASCVIREADEAVMHMKHRKEVLVDLCIKSTKHFQDYIRDPTVRYLECSEHLYLANYQ